MFGDQPGDNKITDPGATVSVVSKGNGQLEENEVAVNENELTRLLALDEESSSLGGGAGDGSGSAGEVLPPNIVEEGQKIVDSQLF